MNQRGLISEENKTLKNSYNILKLFRPALLKHVLELHSCCRLSQIIGRHRNHVYTITSVIAPKQTT